MYLLFIPVTVALLGLSAKLTQLWALHSNHMLLCHLTVKRDGWFHYKDRDTKSVDRS